MNDNPKPESFKPDAVGDKLDTLKAENKALKEQLSTALKSLAVAESQIVQTAADRQQVQAELSDLQKRLNEAEQNGMPVPDLRGKVGDIANYAKHLIAEDRKLPHRKQDKEVKLPKGAISKLEAILGGGDQ